MQGGDELSNDEANRLADEILLRDDFLPAREPGFFTRSVDWVFEQIGRVLEWIFGGLFGGVGGSGAGSAIAYVLLAAAVLVLLTAIVRAIRGRPPADDDELERGARIVFDEVVDPATLRAQLSSARIRGDHRAAVIAAFRLAVLELIEAGVAAESPGATTGDFGRAVGRNRPDLAPVYEPAAAAFERAFYSDTAIDASDLGDVDRLVAMFAGAGTP